MNQFIYRGAGEAILQLGLILAFISLYMSYREAAAGDPAIYFTFIDNFFKKPFSNNSGLVTFGFTSPLFVMVMAPVHAIFGTSWIAAAKAINIFLLYLSVHLLASGETKRWRHYITLTCLVVLSHGLLDSVGALFETGLSFFLISLVIFLMKKSLWVPALLISGLMHLARPELIILTLVLGLYILYRSPSRLYILTIGVISSVPLFSFYTYMYISTGSYLSTSMSARALESAESGKTWVENLSSSAHQIYFNGHNNIYLISLFALVISAICMGKKSFIIIFSVLLLLTPYLIFPPLNYTGRYLIIILPICFYLFAHCLFVKPNHMRSNERIIFGTILFAILAFFCALPSQYSLFSPIRMFSTLGLVFFSAMVIFRRSYFRGFAVASMLLAALLTLSSSHQYPGYDYDTILSKDLAAHLNPITDQSDHILLYEIQGQYYLNARCSSMDGIVGSPSILAALTGDISFEDYLTSEGISYIVTHNGMNYRRIFDDTVIEDIYSHDIENPISSVFYHGKLRLTKILTNPALTDSTLHDFSTISDYNHINKIPVFGFGDSPWSGHSLFWNSVYRVERANNL